MITSIIILFLSIALLAIIWRYGRQKKEVLQKTSSHDLSEREDTFYLVHKWLTEGKKYLDPNINLDRVARGVHLTERQVSTSINTIACRNFNSYINKLRVKEAQSLLLDSAYSYYTIDAIAEMAGFSNKVSFYKAFKKVTGHSPSDFRKAANRSD